jgi:hypothetical protein
MPINYNRTLRIKLLEPTTNKLSFVKLIKDCSGLGLREAKDLCDELHKSPHLVQDMPLLPTTGDVDYSKLFKSEIKNIGGKFLVNGGIQWERNIKMLKLGIGDESDYSEFIKDYILNGLVDSENLLTLALSKLSENDIKEVFNKINLENI